MLPRLNIGVINFYCLESTDLYSLPLESYTNCGKKKTDRLPSGIKKAESMLSWWRNFNQAGKREMHGLYSCPTQVLGSGMVENTIGGR